MTKSQPKKPPARSTSATSSLLFSTSSYQRKPTFQTQTIVTPSQVIKKPLAPQAHPHLQNQLQIIQDLSRSLPQLPILQPKSKKNLPLTFPFQPYPTLAQLIEKSLLEKDFAATLPLLDHYQKLLASLPQKKLSFDQITNDSIFQDLFQPRPSSQPSSPRSTFTCLTPGLLDLTCANLFLLPLKNKKALSPSLQLLAFDQEWLLPALPLDFLIFRNLLDLASRLQSLIQNFCSPQLPCYQLNHQLLIPQVWFDYFHLSPAHLPSFYLWEQNFQNYLNQKPHRFPPLLLNTATGQFPLLTRSAQPLSPSKKIARLQHQVDNLTFQLDLSQKALHQLSSFHQSRLDKLVRLTTHPHYYLDKFLTQEKDFLRQNGPTAYLPRLQNRFHRQSFITQLQAAPLSPSSPISPSSPKILIIAGTPGTVAHIHRVSHLEEKLRLLNLSYLTIAQSALARTPSPSALPNFDLLYIHRATLDQPLQALLDSFRVQNKPVLFDIDDLVFDPAVLPEIAAAQSLSPQVQNLYHETMLKHQEVMRRATLLVTPTQYLSSYAAHFFSLPSAVLPNHLDQTSFDQGRRLGQAHLARPTSSPGRLRLGYFPGTLTHRQDFALIAPTLLKLFAAHPLLSLHIVGHFDPPPQLQPFIDSGQVKLSPAVPFHQLMNWYANLDLNLAPLESAASPFCASKSELKYFFAGICGLPTLATPTPPFAAALKRSHGGRLAATPADWQRHLTAFLRNPQSLQPLAQKAFTDCQKAYSPAEQTKNLRRLLIGLNFPLPKKSR